MKSQKVKSYLPEAKGQSGSTHDLSRCQDQEMGRYERSTARRADAKGRLNN